MTMSDPTFNMKSKHNHAVFHQCMLSGHSISILDTEHYNQLQTICQTLGRLFF